MTLTAQPEVVAAPAWQFFDASVAAVRRLGPSFVRLTLTGPELAGFGAAGCDQRFKLVLSRDDDGLDRLRECGQDWYPEFCAMPGAQRPVIRTYTVRAVRPECAELDVDVVLHGVDDGHAGPAASTAARLRVAQARRRGLRCNGAPRDRVQGVPLTAALRLASPK